MSLNSDIYLMLRSWIYFLLVEEAEMTDLKIIQSHQNTPAPVEPYIVIDAGGNVNNIGRATKMYPPDEETGISKVATDYESITEIWEIGGTGDLLRQIISSTERAEIQQTYFQEKNIAIRGTSRILNIPQLVNNQWTQQAMVELRIGFADTIQEQSSWIETVEYTETIGGKVNE